MSTTLVLGGRYLIRAGRYDNNGDIENDDNLPSSHPRSDNHSDHNHLSLPKFEWLPILASNIPLSFWGGISPETSLVIDTTHPLVGRSVRNTVLCLPGSRGSSTASQVLLELILRDNAPRVILFRDADYMACVGALVAQQVFHQHHSIPDMLHLGTEAFQHLLQLAGVTEQLPETTDVYRYAALQANGELLLSKSIDVTLDVNQSHGMTAAGASPSSTAPRNAKVDDIALSDHEIQILEQAKTPAERMALQVIFHFARLGQEALPSSSPPASPALAAPTYLPVTKAHIDACTYIGPGGLDLVRRLVQAGGKVKIPTTTNAMSTDRQRWSQFQVPSTYAHQALALGEAYEQLGCQPTFTCTPYLLPDPPNLHEQIVWGESNAVVYANSVLGARTEKYADYLETMCALAGIVPAAGVHLDQGRIPTIILDATDLLQQLYPHYAEFCSLSPSSSDSSSRRHTAMNNDWDALFPTLGHVCGELSDGHVPLVVGLDATAGWAVTTDHLKAFCAAFGTTGASPLVHLAGITPEAQDAPTVQAMRKACGPDRIRVVTLEHLQQHFQVLDGHGQGRPQKIDLIALGNPHFSLSECEQLRQLIQNEPSSNHTAPDTKADSLVAKHPQVRIMACMSRYLYEKGLAQGSIQPLEAFGIEFVNDTCWCMLLDPPVIPTDPQAWILTNSGKYAHYGPALAQRRVRFGSLADCVQTARTGVYRAAATTGPEASNWDRKSPRSFVQLMQQQQRQYGSMARTVVRSLIRNIRWR